MSNKKGNELLNLTSFADKLEKVYQKAGDNNKKAAQKLGMDSTALSKIKNGSRAVTVDDLIKISREYGCSIDDLIGVKEGVKESYSKKITARDLCRMLADIEMTWGFTAEFEQHEMSQREIVEWMNVLDYGTHLPKAEKAKISFPLGFGEYHELADYEPDGAPIYVEVGYTGSLYYVHRFIKRLANLKLVDKLDDESKSYLIEKYLQDVPDDLPPDEVY